MKNDLQFFKKALSILTIFSMMGILIFEDSKTGKMYYHLEEQLVALTDIPDNFLEASEIVMETMEEELSEYQNEEILEISEGLTVFTEQNPQDSISSDSQSLSETFLARWRTGNYNYKTGKYESSKTDRISHTDYDKVFGGTTYQVILSNSDFHMLIRELDENYVFIKGSELAGGKKIILSEETAYLGITLYAPQLQDVTYETYGMLFSNGMVADLLLIESNDSLLNQEMNHKESDDIESDQNVADPIDEEKQISLDSFHADWKPGCYSYSSGKYQSSYIDRICHVDYDKVIGGATYQVILTNSDYRMLIRELDENYTFIKTTTLANGKEITLDRKTVFVGISLYAPKLEEITYSTYEKLFADGMTAEFVFVHENEREKTIEEIRTEQFRNTWRVGQYIYRTGIFDESSTSRISHMDYDAAIGGATYKVTLTNPDFKMLIRELDQNYAPVKSYDLSNGKTTTLSEQTAYVGISLYAPNMPDITYETYEKLFADGMIVSFDVIAKEKMQFATFEEVIIDMLEKGNSSSGDVIRYQIKEAEALKLFDKLMKEKYYLLYKCVPGLNLSITCDQNGYVQSVSAVDLSEESAQKYKNMTQKVDAALSLLQDGMSETEKALILHDYLIEHVSHTYNVKKPGYQAYDALVNGNAICQGYADALATLYHQAGLDTILVDGNDEHHAWILVKLDGSYYHIDPTWDDLQNDYRHYYFLRSDTQFKAPAVGDVHYAWTTGSKANADSGKYDNWFIHNVKGNVEYYKGYWYFASGNELKRAKIDGSSMETIAVEGDTVQVESAAENGIRYIAGTETKYYK